MEYMTLHCDRTWLTLVVNKTWEYQYTSSLWIFIVVRIINNKIIDWIIINYSMYFEPSPSDFCLPQIVFCVIQPSCSGTTSTSSAFPGVHKIVFFVVGHPLNMTKLSQSAFLETRNYVIRSDSLNGLFSSSFSQWRTSSLAT